MYLATSTRPDISYSVSALSQFNKNHSETHWRAAKRVLRYLKGTQNFMLKFEPSKSGLQGYVDADWANCQDDRKSYTGYVFKLSNAPTS